MTSALATVRSLHRFPVKSMQGEDLDEAIVGPAGLLGDRAYAVVDAVDGTVASAKYPRKWAALLGLRAAFVTEPRAGEAPPPVAVTFPDGVVRRSDEPGLDDALSALLGRAVRLENRPAPEAQFEEQWPDIDGLAPAGFIEATTVEHSPEGEPVSRIGIGSLAPQGTFFDLAVLHVLTTATLDALRAAAPGSDFDPRRYRPNVLLDVPGAEFAEDGWVGSSLEFGADLRVTVTMSTMRCVMTTLGQDGFTEDRDTLRTIAKHNRRTIEGMGTWACAGVYADVDGTGTVRRGDVVRVVG
ncbi:MOSC domain-containing protein [Pseudonocardia bannensis]|uniref:MOSC domain-containing protein n=1 Tax=Pseudonocardia bannensis TaxID=630973 RepID=A0A848DS50_9PSEU|nr:MOSC N-terminal beta barrel domain-containing protein [Pseudonocardia bannensis]NMH95345.1 MOSC domain-containing protein [Pseudonocardia bannensis]